MDGKEAKAAIFEWIEVFHNRLRRYSTIDYLSPAEFERRYAAKLVVLPFRVHETGSNSVDLGVSHESSASG